MNHLHRLAATAALILLALACAQPPAASGPDAGSPSNDAPDAGADDAGADAGTDAGADAGTDAGTEADAGTPIPEKYELTVYLPPSPDAFAVPLGMAPDGTVIGYSGQEAWGPLSRPVTVAPDGTVKALDVPEPNFGFAFGGSASGAVAGTFMQQPHVWDAQGRHLLEVPGGYHSGIARGVSAGGVIVGSYADSDDALPPNPIGPRPMAWIGAQREMRPLALLDPAQVIGSALAVNPDGQISGYVIDSSGVPVAVIWDDVSADATALSMPAGAVLSEGRGISTAGDVAGRVTLSDFSSRAFVAMQPDLDVVLLPHLAQGNAYAEAFSVNRWGHVVGTASAGAGEAHAVIWHDGQIVDLNARVEEMPQDVRYLSSALAIDDEGRIAAEAVMDIGFGDSVRYIAVLTPIP